jgi:hypothetical protein
MLQKPDRLRIHQIVHHRAQDGADGVESLVRLTDVRQAEIVEQDLLDDEDGDCFREFRSGLHDAEAEGDDLGGEEEVDDV